MIKKTYFTVFMSEEYGVKEYVMTRKISSKKLWKLLIDRDMTKTELRDKTGISTVSLAKLGKDENITTDVLLKICNGLDCDISEIMETVKEKKTEKCSGKRTAGK